MSDKLRYCKTFHGMGSEAAKISDKLKLRLKCAWVEPLLVQPAEKERKKNENSTLEEASGKETRTLEDASRRGEGKAEPSLLRP